MFELTPSFWNNCAEFRGSVIKEWLRRQNKLEWPGRKPPQFNIEAVGEHLFRLR
jgi:hypothetical protein